MATVTAKLDGQRTFILTLAGSVAMLYLLGVASTITSASRPVPVLAEKTPAGVREAVIIPREQYDEMEPEALTPTVVVAEIKATPVAVKAVKPPPSVKTIALSSTDVAPTAIAMTTN